MAEPLRVQTRDLSILFDKSRIYLPENIIGPVDDAIKSMVAFAKKHHELFSREFTIADFPTLRVRLEQVVDYDRKATSTLELLEQEFRQALGETSYGRSNH